MNNSCPLCSSIAESFAVCQSKSYYKCPQCAGVFLEKNNYATLEAEERHYKLHNNNVEDLRYQQFVSPITQAVLADFTAAHLGLDFGAGTGPVISKVLADHNFQLQQYDPFFYPFPQLLELKYDYIVCCEVMEHFNNPHQEFLLLHKLLRPNGKLYCMTDMFDASISFENWYYKNDPTHVFFYQAQTMEWIKETYGFERVEVNKRLIIFSL